MSYNFQPFSDEELNAPDLIPIGIYDFEVVKSTRKVSKSGNPMAELNISVWDKEGRNHFIFDYLVFSSVKMNIKKVSHFSKAVGLGEEYKKGELPEDLERFSGKVEIGIQDEQPKSSGGFYPKKNIVVDYIVSDGTVKHNAPKQDEFNDSLDIPF